MIRLHEREESAWRSLGGLLVDAPRELLGNAQARAVRVVIGGVSCVDIADIVHRKLQEQ